MSTTRTASPGAGSEPGTGVSAAPGADVPVISRALPWLLLVGGALGLTAAAALLVEKILVLGDPEHVPACSLDPVLSCGSVMETPQAEAFGFPNPIIGVVGFSVVVTVAAGLLAGARFHRWFWLGLQAGVLFGAGFVHWLIYQSLYSIGALCPYCMVVWAVMMPLFWYVTLHNLRQGHLRLPRALEPAARVLARYHSVVLTLWFAAVIALIGEAFWTYWTTLL